MGDRCNPSSWEAEAGGQVADPPWLHSETLFKGGVEEVYGLWFLLSYIIFKLHSLCPQNSLLLSFIPWLTKT